MARVTIYHNPGCTSSRNAVSIAEELGVDHDVVLYLKTPPDADALRAVVKKLEGPVDALVRRDSLWRKLGLTEADVGTAEQVVDLLVRHPRLLQRPVLVTGERAIVGRPTDRVRALLAAL